MVTLVPQMNEFGFETEYWMLGTQEGTCPNLLLGWVKGHHRLLSIAQVEDFYEDEPDGHITDLGTLDCSEMDDYEWEEELASILWDNDDVWWDV